MKKYRRSNKHANDEDSTDSTQLGAPHPTTRELVRIRAITKELEALQKRQTRLIKELRELAPDADPDEVEWIQPDPQEGRNRSHKRNRNQLPKDESE